MSYYGAIPFQKADELVENYCIANPSTWNFERQSAQYAGVEDYEFSENQKNEIENLGGVWFSNAAEFLRWLNEYFLTI
jgi:hypothetical protein